MTISPEFSHGTKTCILLHSKGNHMVNFKQFINKCFKFDVLCSQYQECMIWLRSFITNMQTYSNCNTACNSWKCTEEVLFGHADQSQQCSPWLSSDVSDTAQFKCSAYYHIRKVGSRYSWCAGISVIIHMQEDIIWKNSWKNCLYIANG